MYILHRQGFSLEEVNSNLKYSLTSEQFKLLPNYLKSYYKKID